MPHLTADMVLRAPNFINPVRERQLELRGKLISAIENLGATQDQYDVLDLSDNEIGRLENFPLLPRLKTLLLNNNHVSKIAQDLGDSIPNLETLILANNRLVNLSDIDPLSDLTSLTSLSLIDNVLTKKANYRLYVIHKLPSIRLLDFKKIKQKERIESAKLFGEPEKKTKKKPKKKTFVPGEMPSGATLTTLTSSSTPAAAAPKPAAPAKVVIPGNAQLAVQAAVANAKTMEEVHRLERMLKSNGGQIAPDVAMPDAAE